MKIYIAGKFERQAWCRVIRRLLEYMGHTVTAQWLDEINDPPETAAARDLADIDRADGVLVVNQDEGGCGMWVEMGYAFAKGKSVFILGKNGGNARRTPGGFRSVFHHLPGVVHLNEILELEDHTK